MLWCSISVSVSTDTWSTGASVHMCEVLVFFSTLPSMDVMAANSSGMQTGSCVQKVLSEGYLEHGAGACDWTAGVSGEPYGRTDGESDISDAQEVLSVGPIHCYNVLGKETMDCMRLL